MIEAVFTFAIVSALFEFVILMKLKPSTRLRLLGSKRWVAITHTVVIMITILIHFGTITGSMTAITAGLISFLVIPTTRWISGSITNKRYFPGAIKYQTAQLS